MEQLRAKRVEREEEEQREEEERRAYDETTRRWEKRRKKIARQVASEYELADKNQVQQHMLTQLLPLMLLLRRTKCCFLGYECKPRYLILLQ